MSTEMKALIRRLHGAGWGVERICFTTQTNDFDVRHALAN